MRQILTDQLIDLYVEGRPVPVRVCIATGDQAYWEGRCNGCNKQEGRVWIITVNDTMKIRLCESCKKMLKGQLK